MTARPSQRRERARLPALGLSVHMLACGTEQIELRPQAEDAALPGEQAIEPNSGAAEATPAPDGAAAPEGQLLPPADGAARGCKKIDFLFVIDNSISMRDEQSNLTGSFPGFVQVMQRVVDVHDFHMMVVSTSGDREREDEPTLDPAACGDIQGAGRRVGRRGEDCAIQDGRAYMTQEQPDLESTFACVAEVGTGGSFIEEPVDALIAATSLTLNAPGRCNEGFLRDDAILVVTLITDEEDRSGGDPEQWHQILLQVKAGDPNALVLLGLVGDNNVDGGLPWGPCSLLDADGAPRLQQFVDGFGGVLGSVCAPDYTPFFQTAVGSIDGACEDFVPPVIQ